MKGLEKVTAWVEKRGLKRAAVTNSPRVNAELMISKLGLSDFFDVLIIGDECERGKPHPDPYLKALEVLKASKDHTFVFEVCIFVCLTKEELVLDLLLTCFLFFCNRIRFQELLLEWLLGCLLLA